MRSRLPTEQFPDLRTLYVFRAFGAMAVIAAVCAQASAIQPPSSPTILELFGLLPGASESLESHAPVSDSTETGDRWLIQARGEDALTIEPEDSPGATDPAAGEPEFIDINQDLRLAPIELIPFFEFLSCDLFCGGGPPVPLPTPFGLSAAGLCLVGWSSSRSRPR